MPGLTRRSRGIPEPQEVETFWKVVRNGLIIGSTVGSVTHPALGLLSLGAEAINQVQAWVTNRRSNELTRGIADDLYLAHESGTLTIEQIQQVVSSEQFNSILFDARLIAARTHQREKLGALRNAVLNVALGTEADEDRQLLFLSLLERYDKLHLRFLRFFQAPEEYGFRRPEGLAAKNTSIYDVLLKTLPDLGARFQNNTENENFAVGSVIQLRVQDIANDLLVGIKGPFDRIPNFSAPHWTTGLGDSFLRFITSEMEESNNL